MALAKDVMQGGFSAGQAKALGGGYADIVAAGSSITDATAITATNCIVTAADGTKGVSLVGEIGDSVWLFNNSGSTLKVYPESGNKITIVGTSTGTTSAAVSHLTYKTVVYKKVSSTQWFMLTSA